MYNKRTEFLPCVHYLYRRLLFFACMTVTAITPLSGFKFLYLLPFYPLAFRQHKLRYTLTGEDGKCFSREVY